MPPPAVIGNCRRPLASVHLGQQGAMGHAVVEILTRTSAKIVGYLPCNTHGNRRRRGEAGRVEARDIEKSRGIVGLPDDKIVAIGIRGPYPREVGYEPPCGKPRPCFMSEPVHQLQPIGMRRYVGFACLLNCRRADQQVSMNRWRNQHTLAGRRRDLEHRMREHIAELGVQKLIVAPSRKDPQLPGAHHIVHLVSKDTGRIHDGANPV